MDCKPMPIGEVFNSFYDVPAYQRDYVWGQDEVSQLLNDILDNTDSTESENSTTPYFIGALVVAGEQQQATFQVIDGQQRVTTLFLLLCVLLKQLEQKESTHLAIQQKIWSVWTDPVTGKGVRKTRLTLNYEGCQQLIDSAAKSTMETKRNTSDTPAERRLKTAYKVISLFVEKNLKQSSDIERFWAQLCFSVNVVRIDTQDVEQAMVVFEVLNDRGVGLDAFDLLKNRIFQQLSSSGTEEEIVTNTWHVIRSNIQGIEASRPLRFLRYYLTAYYTDPQSVKVTEKNAFKWIQDNKEKLGYESNPLGFLQSLELASKHYKDMLIQNVNHLGVSSMALSSLNMFRTAATRQHMALLLACTRKKLTDKGQSIDFPTELFERLATTIESVLFYAFLVEERSQSLERKFSKWLGIFKNATTIEQIDELRDEMRKDCEDQYCEFYDRVYDSLNANDLTKERLKYILAKFTLHFEKQFKGTPFNSIDKLDRPEIQIEHILPQTPHCSYLEELDVSPEDYQHRCQMLGNLVLIEEPLNQHLGNKEFPEKRSVYSESKLWLTKCLDKIPELPGLKIGQALLKVEHHENWDIETIRNRQASLKSIAREIWSF